MITGDPAKGGIVTAGTARNIAALNPKIKVVHIADAGHNIRRESFAAYLAAVTAFLASISR
jgi:N-formylmaleamate deformylase